MRRACICRRCHRPRYALNRRDDGRSEPIEQARHGWRKEQAMKSQRVAGDAGARTYVLVLDSGDEAFATITARSEEHTSELQSLMRISYAVFCLQKTNKQTS